jgi:hypothetical protein
MCKYSPTEDWSPSRVVSLRSAWVLRSVPKLLKVKPLTTSMRRWSASLVPIFPLLCVLIIMALSPPSLTFVSVSMPQISRLWPSPILRSSLKLPSVLSTEQTDLNRPTLRSSIHHVIRSAIDPLFTPEFIGCCGLCPTPGVCYSEVFFFLFNSSYKPSAFISKRVGSELRLHAPVTLHNPQA